MSDEKILKLPTPRHKGSMSLEAAIKARKTTRELSAKSLSLDQVSQLLWALQGVTQVEEPSEGKPLHYRTAPSSGRAFPLEVYTLLPSGFYHFKPFTHELHRLTKEDLRAPLSAAAYADFNQEAIQTSPLTIVLTVDNKTALKMTPLLEDVIRYVHLEAGHATQNLALQAASLGLGLTMITSFKIGMVYPVLKLPLKHRPIYLLPIGYPPDEDES
jgi:SagB-type dehydrogenase family enzyme